jgi:hypothetical protein
MTWTRRRHRLRFRASLGSCLIVAGMISACTSGGPAASAPGSPIGTSSSQASIARCRSLSHRFKDARDGVAFRPASESHLHLRVGDRQHFTLVAYQLYTGWTTPASSGGNAVRLAGVKDPLQHGVSYNCLVTGVIVAQHPGSAWVSADTDLPCFHARPPCLPPTMGWRVHVVVSRN